MILRFSRMKTIGPATLCRECLLCICCYPLPRGALAGCRNLTDSSRNSNKYYELALLRHDQGDGADKPWVVWSHNGRAGYRGAFRTYDFSKFDAAWDKFSSIFEAKIGREWGSPNTPVRGKYVIVDVDHEAASSDDAAGESSDEGADAASPAKKARRGNAASSAPPPPSKLPEPVKALVQQLTDVSALSATLASLHIDVKRAPLGKLTRTQIAKGYRILSKLQGAINSDNGAKCRELSNDFYSAIPHNFGFSVPPTVKTVQQLQELEQTLFTLTQVDIAFRALKSKKANVHPTDFAYTAMGARMLPIPDTTELFASIGRAIKGTHADTHKHYDMSLRQVFALDLKGQSARFAPYAAAAQAPGVPPTRLLWHGTRTSNLVGILSQGLRVAPPEAPTVGYMFGKGIYFADSASKSANYCFAEEKDGSGILLLCEVFTGTPHVLAKAQYIEGKPPAPAHSTLGAGRTVPEPKGDAPLTGIKASLQAAVEAVEGSGYAAPTVEDIMGPQACLESASVSYGPLRGVNDGSAASGATAAAAAAAASDDDSSDEEDMTLEAAQAKAAEAAQSAGAASSGEQQSSGSTQRAVDAKGVDIERDGDLIYNEYIVYSEDQVRVRFACMVDFHFHSAAE